MLLTTDVRLRGQHDAFSSASGGGPLRNPRFHPRRLPRRLRHQRLQWALLHRSSDMYLLPILSGRALRGIGEHHGPSGQTGNGEYPRCPGCLYHSSHSSKKWSSSEISANLFLSFFLCADARHLCLAKRRSRRPAVLHQPDWYPCLHAGAQCLHSGGLDCW